MNRRREGQDKERGEQECSQVQAGLVQDRICSKLGSRPGVRELERSYTKQG